MKELLPVEEAIDCVASAYAELSAGSANVPDRHAIETDDGVTLVMPGHLAGEEALAVKIVSVYPDNPAKGKSAIYGVVNVFDSSDGSPLAIMEGAYLTALRTGASVGLATKLLSRKDSTALAMIGLGAQSRTIIPAVCSVRSIDRVFAFDTDQAAVESFLEEIGDSVSVEACSSANEAVASSDIVCTATTSRKPVFDGAALKPGTHINGIGSFTPEMSEIGFDALTKISRIVIDSKSAALLEAGDLIQGIDAGVIEESDIDREIGEIILGRKSGRQSEDEVSFFKSVGNAALDITVANEIYRRAQTSGTGFSVSLD